MERRICAQTARGRLESFVCGGSAPVSYTHLDVYKRQRKDLARSTRPSLLSQLAKFKELAQALGRDKVKNKEHGGPER